MKVELRPGYKLMATQAETLKVMAQNPKYMDLSEMGAGKTWPQCVLAKGVIDDGICDYVVIAAPKVVLDDWYEVFKNVIVCDHTKLVTFLHGIPAKIRPFVTLRPIVILSYETLAADFDRFEKLFQENRVMFVQDEAHRQRTPGERKIVRGKVKWDGSRRTGMCTILCHLAKRAYLLTGSPFVNGLKNAFAYIHMMRPGQYYTSMRHFQLKHMVYKDGTLVAYKHTETVTAIIDSMSIRYLKRQIMELPPVTFQTRYLDWEPAQKAYYKKMVKDCIIELPNRFIEAHDAGPRLIRLHQILTNPQQLGLEADSTRFAALDDDLEAIGVEDHKVVIFAHYQHSIERLREKYKHLNPAVIYGKTTDVEKEKKKFNLDSTCRIMIANPISAGVGINLSISSHAIFFEYSYDLDAFDQAIARLDRPGQKWPVTIILYAVRGSMEQTKIIPRLISKKEFSIAILRDPKEFMKFIEIDETSLAEAA